MNDTYATMEKTTCGFEKGEQVKVIGFITLNEQYPNGASEPFVHAVCVNHQMFNDVPLHCLKPVKN